MSKSNDNRYDFKTIAGIKYEVKLEPSSKKTNNYFIAHFAYGKPSGIATTQAQFYIFTNTDNYYLINVDELKQIVQVNWRIMFTRDGLTAGHIVKISYINDASIFLGTHIALV